MNVDDAAVRSWVLFTVPDRMRAAIKVALSITLAFLIPMAMGWSQGSTAAITVMVIAAAGDTRQSLMAGSLRLGGTVVGAIVGLTLIAWFAQDRLYYLLSVSLAASLFLYLSSAYKGDGTVFMLSAVVMLMVFNGGDAENAFLYGVDRAYMTMFGVLVYTLVCSFLWPDHAEYKLEQDAQKMLALDVDLLKVLRHGVDNARQREVLQSIVEAENALAANWQAANRQMDDVASYRREWQGLISTHRALSRELSSALEPVERSPMDYAAFIHDYDSILDAIERQFTDIDRIWQGQAPQTTGSPVVVFWQPQAKRDLSHLEFARVAARVHTLREMLRLGEQLRQIVICLSTLGEPLKLDIPASGGSQFQWLDLESVKLAVRVFITFWIAVAVWVTINPPGGFVFVTMSVLLLPLVSFTPLPPKLLYILFSIGFVFAVPCYVFLLPSLSQGYQLGLFLFAYSFFGQYVFKGPIAIFFMLGLMTLGIGNTMNYNMAVLFTTMLLFYLVITCLVFSSYFVFNAKPEYLFNLMRRRFFRHTRQLLYLRVQDPTVGNRRRMGRYRGSLVTTLAKMKLWAGKVDTGYFHKNNTADLLAFAEACELLDFRTSAIVDTSREHRNPLLVGKFKEQFSEGRFEGVLGALSARHINAATYQAFDRLAPSAQWVESGLNKLFQDVDTDSLSEQDIAYFYTQLNQLALLWHGLASCEKAMQAIDWQQLGESRF